MLAVRVLFCAAMAILAMSTVERVTAGDPICLAKQCGPPLGALTIYCSIACIAAGYGAGFCNNTLVYSPPNTAACYCTGGSDPDPALLTLPLACAATCGAGCFTCEYYGTATCTQVIGNANAVNCTCT